MRNVSSKERILELFRFIDWLIILPDYLEQQLELDLEELEKEELMPFISRIERRWLEKGLAQGIEQGIERGRQEGHQEGHQEGRQEGTLLDARESVLDNLEVRFGNVPENISQAINKMTEIDQLKMLRRKAIQVMSLEEFYNQMLKT